MAGEDFLKGDDFRKSSPPPYCRKCGMMTNDNFESSVRNAHAWCNRCEHEVDKEGECVARGRCVACRGRPKCSRCGGMTDKSTDASNNRFECNNCNHPVDDDGDCTKRDCRTCNPYLCNSCNSTLDGELDSDGEIHCSNCDHYVDSSGDCMSGYRGHCDTCDTYPECPSCGADTYHEWDDDEERSEYYCTGDCEHRLDYDGDCCEDPCPDCGTECSNCGASTECNNGPSCSYELEGNCRFCHCNDPYLPNCPDCGDSQDVEGPDGDGDYWCNYEDCDSSNYFQ